MMISESEVGKSEERVGEEDKGDELDMKIQE